MQQTENREHQKPSLKKLILQVKFDTVTAWKGLDPDPNWCKFQNSDPKKFQFIWIHNTEIKTIIKNYRIVQN